MSQNDPFANLENRENSSLAQAAGSQQNLNTSTNTQNKLRSAKNFEPQQPDLSLLEKQANEKLLKAHMFEATEVKNEPETKATVSSELANDENLALSEKSSWFKPIRLFNPWTLLIVSIAAISGYEWLDMLVNQFTSSPVLVSLYSVFFASLAFIVGKLGWQEYRALRSLKKQTALQSLSSDQAQASFSKRQAVQLCEAHYAGLQEVTLTSQSEKFISQQQHCQHAQDVFELYQSTVLTELDKQAHRLIAKTATETAVITALSPLAILDMLGGAIKQIRMVNQLARLYGVEFGYIGRVRLVKHILLHMSLTGGSELLTDLAADSLSVDLTGRISLMAAQGLGVGLLTARLGARSVQAIRPFTHNASAVIKLTDIRKALIKELTEKLKSKTKS
ncbi:TIGR01620 family protein [Saccharobesus litoralis]|uniref:TIGR01620 family protein n=1 Tax=Saccharobesus litoralis TaxID=2172099 RepID=A0A2S0VSD9_9ALTE|nr:TIGR01620 family protein [Saccharobesus litoralis]AWB67103.1 TIGR01620 family protein [Saccharobesus litoralis]